MTSLQLNVAIFFWGSAVVVGIDAIKTEGWRRIVLWLLTFAFVVAGFLVKPLWDVFPDISAALVSLVKSPVTWFVLAAVAYLGLRRPSQSRHLPASGTQESGRSAQPVATAKAELTDTEREGIAATLHDVAEFAGVDLVQFYHLLTAADLDDPRFLISRAEELNEERSKVEAKLEALWHRRGHYLRQIDLDVTPLMSVLQEMTGPLLNAGEARDWPRPAQAVRVQPILQAMSDVGGYVNNLKELAAEKRREYLG